MNAAILGETIAQNLKKALEETENKIDDELEKLNHLDEDDLEVIRERRRQEMKQKRLDAAGWKSLGHGCVLVSGGETDFFAICKQSPKIFCHIHHPTINVERSEYLKKHMITLAEKYLDIAFVNVDAEKHPFLVNRLNVYVIPTEMKMSHVTAGFSELNDSDDWQLTDLENLLKRWDMFKQFKPTWRLTRKEIIYPDDEEVQ